MKIYDISQEIFSCCTYPGDPKPQKEFLSSIRKGDLYNLSIFSMCSHNGTHIDSPFHFIENGKTTEKITLEKVVGFCYVAEHNGILNEIDAIKILNKAGKNQRNEYLLKEMQKYRLMPQKYFQEKKYIL